MPVTVSFRGLCAETGMDKPLRVKVESHDPAPAFRGDAFRVGPALDGVELNRPGVSNKLVHKRRCWREFNRLSSRSTTCGET